MWSDFFYFSRSDRRAIWVLLLVGMVAWGVALYRESRRELPAQTDRAALDSFQAQVTRRERVPRRYDAPVRADHRRTVGERFVFDPNRADSLTLRRLGLSPYVVRNILRYRARGGVFRRPDSFARIYGLSEAQFRCLEPYIRIEAAREGREAEADSTAATDARPALPLSTGRDTLHAAPPVAGKYPEGTVLDLNTADVATLCRIPGIGAYRARLIVDYRRALGGYVRLEQLGEIKDLPAGFERWFEIGTPPAPSLRVNRWSVEQLRRHPYLTFYQAKIIVEHRRKYGALSDLSALSLYPEFTEDDLARLRPYVRLD